MQLFGQNILVKILEDKTEKITSGGIYLPDQGKKVRLIRGLVIAVGDGRVINDEVVTKTDLLVEPGQTVVFSNAARVVEVDNECVIIEQSSLLGKE